MKKFLLLGFLLCGITSFSQISFENGYYINNSNERVECLIQNKEWKDNPESFEYKLTSSATVNTAGLEGVQEFKVGNSLYRRATVNIDQSSQRLSYLSSKREPEFKEETVFLKVLVKGTASLMSYSGHANYYFFFKKADAPVQQLIYKEYLVDGKIASNKSFRQQLYRSFSCPDVGIDFLKETDYRKEELVKLFEKYNTCLGSEYSLYEKDEKWKFQLIPFAGIDFVSLNVSQGLMAHGNTFSTTGYRFGAEMDFIFPFYKNKLGVKARVAYTNFSTSSHFEKDFSSGYNYSADYSFNYRSFDVSLGPKYYFFLSGSTSIHVDAGLVVSLPINSEIHFANTGRVLDPELTNFDPAFGYELGVGLEFKNIVMGAHYIFHDIGGYHAIPKNYILDWKSNYSALSFTVGYQF